MVYKTLCVARPFVTNKKTALLGKWIKQKKKPSVLIYLALRIKLRVNRKWVVLCGLKEYFWLLREEKSTMKSKNDKHIKLKGKLNNHNYLNWMRTFLIESIWQSGDLESYQMCKTTLQSNHFSNEGSCEFGISSIFLSHSNSAW